MRCVIILAVYLAASTSALASAGIAHAVDGDTLTIGRERIRIFGIDAPEAQQTCRIRYSNWTCGADATAALRSMVEGKQVTCEALDTDVYGRTVARCHVGRLDVAAELVRSGMAVVYGRGGDLYGGIEAAAKGNRAGVWASEFEMPAAYREAHPRDPAEGSRIVIPASQLRATARRSAPTRSLGFHSCAAARAAGAAPMYRGQTGYNPNLDGDNDGIACEPFRVRRR